VTGHASRLSEPFADLGIGRKDHRRYKKSGSRKAKAKKCNVAPSATRAFLGAIEHSSSLRFRPAKRSQSPLRRGNSAEYSTVQGQRRYPTMCLSISARGCFVKSLQISIRSSLSHGCSRHAAVARVAAALARQAEGQL
jgi:hypothetical protein